MIALDGVDRFTNLADTVNSNVIDVVGVLLSATKCRVNDGGASFK